MFGVRSKGPRATDDSLQSTGPPAMGLPLPRLEYNLMDHRQKLSWMTALLVIECSILPIALFYGLWYGTTLKHGPLFAIITAFFGFVTGIEFAHRSLRLIQKADKWRPIGGRRWHFDFSHMTLSVAYTVMTGVLIGASIPHEPIVPALAMPVSYFLVQIGLQMVVSGAMHACRARAPFRISSVPRGARVRPLLYTFIEDIVGVEGNGKLEYRERLKARYEASARFRTMIIQLNWFWGAGGLACGVALIAIVWTIPQQVAYGVGWGVPLIFVIVWTAATIYWTMRSLRTEKELWDGLGQPDVTTEAAVVPMREQEQPSDTSAPPTQLQDTAP